MRKLTESLRYLASSSAVGLGYLCRASETGTALEAFKNCGLYLKSSVNKEQFPLLKYSGCKWMTRVCRLQMKGLLGSITLTRQVYWNCISTKWRPPWIHYTRWGGSRDWQKIPRHWACGGNHFPAYPVQLQRIFPLIIVYALTISSRSRLHCSAQIVSPRPTAMSPSGTINGLLSFVQDGLPWFWAEALGSTDWNFS